MEKFLESTEGSKVRQRDTVVQILEKFSSTEPRISKITDLNLQESLNAIRMKDFIVAFDCEFYQTVNKDHDLIGGSSTLHKFVAPFVRELGMIILIYDWNLNQWWSTNSIHVNFTSPLDFGIPERSTKLIIQKYADVTIDTRKQMMEVEDTLASDKFIKEYLRKLKREDKIPFFERRAEKILHEIYPQFLSKKYYKLAIEQNKLYQADKLVKARTLTVEQTEDFLELFSSMQKNSTLLIKGRRDLDALCNNMTLLNMSCPLSRSSYYDIEIFNSLSRKFFKSAQLYDTYNGLLETEEYNLLKKPLSSIIATSELREHNPVFDAYFTLVVAVTLNLMLIRRLDKTT